ncbi:MAG: MFS transporter [Betaproteobacteria bacterium]
MQPAAERPLWRNADYMLLWSGQVVSTLGTTATTVVYPLLILAITGSPEAAGIGGAFRAVPYVLLSLPAGALVDRWDRKRVMILCDLGRLAATLGIVASMAFDVLTVAQIYVAMTIEGSLFVFFNLAEVAALPRVVAPTRLPQATAQNEAAFGAANIVGPSLGTWLFQAIGRSAPFVFDAVSYAVSVGTLVRIRAALHGERLHARKHLGREIVEGLGWLWGQHLIRYMAFLTGMLNLVNAAMPLLMIVLAKRLGAADAQIGLIFSLAGIGGIAGSLLGGQIQRRFTFGQVIVACVWLEALVFPMFALAPSFWLLAAVAGFSALLGPVYNVVQFSYRLSLIPDALQGRVNSTFRLIAFGFMPLGAALSGLLIERFDAATAVIAFSVVLLATAATTALYGTVRRAARVDPGASHA